MSTGFEQDLKNTHWIEVRTLTPVHVGTDQSKVWLKNIDFDYEKGKIYPIDKEAFLHSLKKDEIQKLSLDVYSKELSDQRRRHRIGEEYDFPSKCVSNRFESINPQIRDGMGRPYLPGSSIKGAIRAILHATKNPQRRDEKSFVVSNLLGKIDQSPMRFLRVSDSYLPKTAIYPAKILSLHDEPGDWVAGWKHKRNGSVRQLNPDAFMTAFEAFPAGSAGILRLGLLPGLMGWVKSKPSDKALDIVGLREIESISALFRCINQNIRRRIEAEYKYIEKVAGSLKEYDQLLEAWQQLKDRIPDEQEADRRCILRLGRNVGAHSTTGNWEYPDEYYSNTIKKLNSGKIGRKTRRFALLSRDGEWEFQPFGFVELRLADDAEAARLRHAELLVVPEKPKPVQVRDSFAEEPEQPLEPPKPVAAELFKGKLKIDAVIDATAISVEGDDVFLELHIEGGNQTVKLRYATGLKPGTIHRVIVVKVKDGKVSQVKYKSAKK
jgi:hypothetical protein